MNRDELLAKWTVTNLAAPPAAGLWFRCRHCKEVFVPIYRRDNLTVNDERDACLAHEEGCR